MSAVQPGQASARHTEPLPTVLLLPLPWRDAMKEASVLLKNRPEFHRDCQCYANVKYVREYGLQVLTMVVFP